MTETFTIKSSRTNHEYQVTLGLPYTYEYHKDRKYLTVYLLDANLFAGIVSGITRLLECNPSYPELLVVGIGYPLAGLYGENGKIFQTIRTKDFTPIHDDFIEKEKQRSLGIDHMETGGASDFLRFLAEELVPKVESSYRSQPEHRTLVGDSLGGLFALYTLFQRPQVFRNYIIGSPAISYGAKELLRIEEKYYKHTQELVANLYMGIGGKEEVQTGVLSLISVSDFLSFVSLLESRNYNGLSLTNKVFEEDDHFSVPALVIQAGLKSIFAA
jgi:predicted alpha/beta superfamily hydrolase